nr:retrovirus-related Pol polyprotein from transposon TNT 1-94 [Tanacetum cinerariifolium]
MVEGQFVGNQNGYNAIQNAGNQNRNGNVVAARAGGTVNRDNSNQIRSYNCRGVGHYARNCIVKPRRMDVAFLQTQLLIAQKKEAKIQIQAKEFDLMAYAGDIDEIEKAEAIATACYTQNHSLIHLRFNKTPYELINDKKPDISFLHVFRLSVIQRMIMRILGGLIMETINVIFDELSAMDFKQRISKPKLQGMTSGHISLGLALTYAPSSITSQKLTERGLDLLFEAMHDDYIGGQQSAAPAN